jgi:hypothetical protein
MGIYYGDIHYGVKIAKKIYRDGDIFLEPNYEVIFDNNAILLNSYLDNVKNIYLQLLEPHRYQYELFADIFTTHNGIVSNKAWQRITMEQMNNFINGMYKIDYLPNNYY